MSNTDLLQEELDKIGKLLHNFRDDRITSVKAKLSSIREQVEEFFKKNLNDFKN